MTDNNRLQDLEDIRTMRAAYTQAYDTADLDAVVEQFAVDAVLDAGRWGEVEGHAAIRAFYRERMAETGRTRHFISNPLIEFTGATSAKGQWYLMDVLIGRAEDGKQVPILYGTYQDLYTKVDGQWKLQRMKVEIDWPSAALK